MTLTLEHQYEYTTTFTQGDTLFAYAHPDDEFLTGAAIDLVTANGGTVYALYASDGEASDRGDTEFLRTRQRRHEAGRALGRYGVRSENIHFLGLPDGRLDGDDHITATANAIGRMVSQYPIRTVVTLGEQGYDDHQDHIAVHMAAEIAVAAYASANPNLSLVGLTRKNTPIQLPANAFRKISGLVDHRSQFGIDMTDPDYIPAPGTVEQPGIRLSELSRGYLARYAENLQHERYEEYSFD